MPDAVRLMEVARTKLVVFQPFLGTLAMFLAPSADRSVPAMGTDGRRLRYNPAWVKTLAAGEGMGALAGAVAHEVLHCALGHLWRRGSRERRKWNVAADYAANFVARQAGLKLPEGALFDPELGAIPAEEIYARLPDPPPPIPAWSWHELWSEPDGGEETCEGPCDTEELWRQAVAAAAQAMRGQGDLPGYVKAMVDAALAPRVPWRAVLAEFVERARFEYAWMPPDGRFLAEGLILPDYGGEGVGEVVAAVDTSGSISDRELCQFLSEVRAIWEANVMILHVVDCDAAAYHFRTLERGDAMPDLEVTGRGGTDFRPVFSEVETRRLQPSCLVFLTDGEGSYPEKAPPYPVLWVLSAEGAGKPPWGRVVRMS